MSPDDFIPALKEGDTLLATRGIALIPRVRDYLESLVRTSIESGLRLSSVILFGSGAIGGFSTTASDVDLILVVPDDTSIEDRNRLRIAVERIEAIHGFGKKGPQRKLAALVEKATANLHSFFICSRSDLLSGRVEQILAMRPSQALFVDRVVIPSIITSAVTVWGEDLLLQIPMAPIRRFDVLKAFHGPFAQALLIVAVFPFLPDATKYAMGVMKRFRPQLFLLLSRPPGFSRGRDHLLPAAARSEPHSFAAACST
jgi:predicted nucleotidyltransferase